MCFYFVMPFAEVGSCCTLMFACIIMFSKCKVQSTNCASECARATYVAYSHLASLVPDPSPAIRISPRNKFTYDLCIYTELSFPRTRKPHERTLYLLLAQRRLYTRFVRSPCALTILALHVQTETVYKEDCEAISCSCSSHTCNPLPVSQNRVRKRQYIVRNAQR